MLFPFPRRLYRGLPKGKKGLAMRAIIWAVAVLAVLWCGYWVVGARAIDRGVAAAVAGAQAEGLVVAGEASVAGFPNRFDLTLTAPEYGNPATGFRWSAPFAQVFAMTWKPWHVIAVLANDQTLDLPGQSLGIRTADIRASLVSRPVPALPLDRIAISATGVDITSTAGWGLAADVAELHTRPDAGLPNGHQFALDIRTIAPRIPALAGSGLPATIPVIAFTGAVGFSAPIDRHAGDTAPRATAIRIDSGRIDWGPLQLTARGQIAPGADGLAEGRVEVAITGWREAIPLAVAAGLFSEQAAALTTGLLAALARQSGNENELNLPLTYADGVGMFGPIPLGPAPRLN
jgi:hypothetical protein